MRTFNLLGFLAKAADAFYIHFIDMWFSSINLVRYWYLVKYTFFGWPAKRAQIPGVINWWLTHVREVYNVNPDKKGFPLWVSAPINLLSLAYSISFALYFSKDIQENMALGTFDLYVESFIMVYWTLIAFIQVSTFIMLVLAENEKFDDDLPSSGHGPFSPEY